MGYSLLYKKLKEKADDPYTQNNVGWYEDNGNPISFKELMNYVDSYKKLFKEKTIREDPYLLANNNIYSISMLIALLDLGYSPILLNLNQYHSTDNRINTDKEHVIYFKNNVIGVLSIDDLNEFKIRKKLLNIKDNLNNIKNMNTVGIKGKAKIGLLTSGSTDKPKIVYLDEDKIYRNIKNSELNNRYRKIYNPISMSSISGLFTNVFLPITTDFCQARLSNDFSIMSAILCTDVFLNRNIQDIFKNHPRIEYGEIERFFIFGEPNSIDHVQYIHDRFPLNKFEIINVYGSTESGGLVSECREKDIDSLSIYEYNLENDTIIYSYDRKTFKKRHKDIETVLSENEVKEIINNICIELIPCGLKNDNIKINGYNIGEGIIDNSPSGDVFVFLNNKVYVLGRKTDLIKNISLSIMDNAITNHTNRKCTAFNDNGDIYLAVCYPLEYTKTALGNDHTTYFRRFIDEAHTIKDYIKKTYPQIKDVLFLADYNFPINNISQKSKRNDFHDKLATYEIINYRLEHFKEVLKDYVESVFKERLHHIPNYSFNDCDDLVIPINEITETELVDITNDLNIVAIEKDYYNNQYIIYYDDGFFFDPVKVDKYSEDTIDFYRKLASIDLFIPKLLSDNCWSYTKDIIGRRSGLEICYYSDLHIYAKIGMDSEGNTIMLLYYQDERMVESIINEHREQIEKIIDKDYKDIIFEDVDFYAYANDEINELAYFEHPIIIKKDGTIVGNYRDKLIANAYINQDVIINAKRKYEHKKIFKMEGKK